MNHPFDSDDKIEDPKDLKLLEILIDKGIKGLESKSYKPKIQDALKAIQLKEKLSEASRRADAPVRGRPSGRNP